MWRYAFLFLVVLPSAAMLVGFVLYRMRERFPWWRERRILQLERENQRLDSLYEHQIDKLKRERVRL
jgi:hypothetical protein